MALKPSWKVTTQEHQAPSRATPRDITAAVWSGPLHTKTHGVTGTRPVTASEYAETPGQLGEKLDRPIGGSPRSARAPDTRRSTRADRRTTPSAEGGSPLDEPTGRRTGGCGVPSRS